jgi:Flp pilus assembly protein TadD
MRTALIVLAAAPFALAVLPAQAQRPDGDPLASTAIAQSDFSSAERKLVSELRQNPGAPEVLLNLAVVYAKTGRVADARATYRQVLAQKDIAMDLSGDRVSMSHAIATTGLQRISVSQLSSR